MTTLTKNLKDVKKVFGFTTKIGLYILLGLTMSTCSGPRLMLGNQTLGKQIDYSTFSEKLARQIHDATGCATLKIDVLDSLSWHQAKQLTSLQLVRIQDTVYYLNPGRTLKPCLLIKSCQYPSTTLSFSNQYRTEWIGLRPNWHIVYLPVNSHGVRYSRVRGPRSSRGWTPPSIGKIPEITPMTGRNSNSLYMTNPGNGKDRTTSSTTGELPKQH